MDKFKLASNLALIFFATATLTTIFTTVANAKTTISDEKMDHRRGNYSSSSSVGGESFSDSPNCGKEAGNKKCQHGLCCSQWGFCGSKDEYCGDGCQDRYGTCGGGHGGGGGDERPPSSGAPPPCSCEDQQSVVSSAVVADDVAVGGSGYSRPSCGKGEGGGGKCSGKLCCSNFGFCGSAAEYCGDGCQRGYGRCHGGGGGGKTPPRGGGKTPPHGGGKTPPPHGGVKTPPHGGKTPPHGGGKTPPRGGGHPPPGHHSPPPRGGHDPPPPPCTC